jgi:hypothetical protein
MYGKVQICAKKQANNNLHAIYGTGIFDKKILTHKNANIFILSSIGLSIYPIIGLFI